MYVSLICYFLLIYWLPNPYFLLSPLIASASIVYLLPLFYIASVGIRARFEIYSYKPSFLFHRVSILFLVLMFLRKEENQKKIEKVENFKKKFIDRLDLIPQALKSIGDHSLLYSHFFGILISQFGIMNWNFKNQILKFWKPLRIASKLNRREVLFF